MDTQVMDPVAPADLLQERLRAEEERNRPIAPRGFRPGFWGVGFALPAAEEIEVGDRLCYLNEGLQVVLLDILPDGKYRGVRGRESRRLCVTTPAFRGGAVTFDAADAEGVFDFHPEAKDDRLDARQHLRLYRIALSLYEGVCSAARRHNAAWQKSFAAPQKVRYGGEEHDELPDAETWFPEPLIAMPDFQPEVVWAGLHYGKGGGLHESLQAAIGAQLKCFPVLAPCDGHYLGADKSRRGDGLQRHLFRTEDGDPLEMLLPAEALMHPVRQIGPVDFLDGRRCCKVQQGREIGYALKPIAELDRLEDPVKRYHAARRLLGVKAVDCLEQLFIVQSVVWVKEMPCLPWGLFQIAFTAAPEYYLLWAWDFTKAGPAFDGECDAICLPANRMSKEMRIWASRERRAGRAPGIPEYDVEVNGIRVVLPPGRDPRLLDRARRPAEKKAPAAKNAPAEPPAAAPVLAPASAAETWDHHVAFLRTMRVPEELITKTTRRRNSAPTLDKPVTRRPKASHKKRVETASALKPNANPLDDLAPAPAPSPVAEKSSRHPLVAKIAGLLKR